MSQYRIGPFGRILPVLHDGQPEETTGPLDETRSTSQMASSSIRLPQPPLNFGSDSNPGFTDPMRYIQGGRAQSTRRSMDTVTSRSNRDDPLPSVNQLLTPGTQSKTSSSPYSSQQSPEPLQNRSSVVSNQAAMESARSGQGFGYSYPASNQQAQSPFQHQMMQHMVPAREEYQAGPQQITPSYMPHPGQHHLSSIPYQGLPPQASYPQPQVPQGSSHGYTSHLPQQSYPYQVSQEQSLPARIEPLPTERSPEYDHPTNSALGSGGEQRSVPKSIKPMARVVADDDLPGEGPVWIYEDGTRIPKEIEGEAVNASWGITKAGKPRKRLAIACTTCREKKIKCDPAEPKCVQCEKFGRECRFTTAVRTHPCSPESPSYDSQARFQSIKIKTEGSIISRPKLFSASNSTGSLDQVIKRRNSSPDLDVSKMCQNNVHGNPYQVCGIKKRRSVSPKPVISIPQSRHYFSARNSGLQSDRADDSGCQGKVLSEAYFAFDMDPYIVDEKTSKHYIALYFAHVNSTTHRIFPAGPFVDWIENGGFKSKDDLILIYAMLAMGTIYSTRAERKAKGSVFFEIAQRGAQRSDSGYSLQLAQSRLLIALYQFACGDFEASWDHVGMGMRTISGLKLNLEDECRRIMEDDVSAFGLNGHALTECCRRTYWSAYIMDRFTGYCIGYVSGLQSEDSFLRLPCQEARYESQYRVDTPYFDNGYIDESLCHSYQPSNLGPMAYLIQITSIWGDVLGRVYRSSCRSAERYSSEYEAFHGRTHERLASWMKSLPSELVYSHSNAAGFISRGDVGLLLKLHALYHMTIIKLNRDIRHTHLTPACVERNLLEAQNHAYRLLEMMEQIHLCSQQTYPSSSQATHPTPNGDNTFCSPRTSYDQNGLPQDSCSLIAGSSPFVGLAILTAVDIISARGLLEPDIIGDVIKKASAGLEVVDELSYCWASAIHQKKQIRKRIEQLAAAISAKVTASAKKAWRIHSPMDPVSVDGQDAFYDESTSLRQLGSEIKEEDVLVIG